MNWLQDRKNLPFVIAGASVMILAAAYFLFLQIRGPYIPDAPPTTASAPLATDTGTPAPAANNPPSTPAPTPAATTPASTATAPTPAQPAAGAPASFTTGAAPAPARANPGTQTASATGPKPKPMLVWRPDPFALISTSGTKGKPPVHRLYFPMPPRVFAPKPIPINVIFRQVEPEPVRRVAGIMIGDRIRALLQTPDGWELVKAGDPLKDGSTVERIERDRVYIRQAESDPNMKQRLLVVRLASEIPQSGTTATSSSGSKGRSSIRFNSGSGKSETRAL